MDRVAISREQRSLSRRWVILTVIACVLFPNCKSTVATGKDRYAYQVAWHILKEIRDMQGLITEREIDEILNKITDDKCREWALEWRAKKLIFLASFENSDAVVLNSKSKSLKDGEPVYFVMQKNFESPKSISAQLINLRD